MAKMDNCVYRYIDITDGIIKYVGVVHKGDLRKRLCVHSSRDKWKLKGVWKIQYIQLRNRSEVEAYESHLISLYGTDKYYNKSKKGWGVNRFLPDVEAQWKDYEEENFADRETKIFIYRFKELIRAGYGKDILPLLECIEVTGV